MFRSGDGTFVLKSKRSGGCFMLLLSTGLLLCYWLCTCNGQVMVAMQTNSNHKFEKEKTTFIQTDLLWILKNMQPCITFGMQRKASISRIFLQPSYAAWTLVQSFLPLLPVCRCAGVGEVERCINCCYCLLGGIGISHSFQDSSVVVEIFHQLQRNAVIAKMMIVTGTQMSKVI